MSIIYVALDGRNPAPFKKVKGRLRYLERIIIQPAHFRKGKMIAMRGARTTEVVVGYFLNGTVEADTYKGES